MKLNKKGVSLIELLVVIAILGLILAALFESYIFVLKQHVQQSEIASTDISNVMGLELLKKDIIMAGFGLPHNYKDSYSEAGSSSSYTPDPATLNCKDPHHPSAFSFSNNGNTNANNSDVLVIRSSVAAINETTRQWGIIDSEGYKNLGPDNGTSGYFLILKSDFSFMKYANDVKDESSSYKDVWFAFGLSTEKPRMPFNRVDYYLETTSKLPKRCLPTTYELYRAIINQNDGRRNRQPILDCVKDFQVSFFIDDGINRKWQSSLPDSAEKIRKQLKLVKIFILHQVGRYDSSYTYPYSTITLGDNDTKTLNTITLNNQEKHCRWHIITLTVKPLNLKPETR